MSDFVSSRLLALTARLVGEYTDRNATSEDVVCHYACSDHASWHNQGYRAVMATEAGPHQKVGHGQGVQDPNAERLNPAYHSPRDVIAHVNEAYLRQFTVLALSWAIEMTFVRPRHPRSSFDLPLPGSSIHDAAFLEPWQLIVVAVGLAVLVGFALFVYLRGSNCGVSGQASYDSVPGVAMELDSGDSEMAVSPCEAETRTISGVLV